MFKKKKKILTAYCNSDDLIKLFPILQGKASIPSWFTKLPVLDPRDDIKNVRTCPGIVELYKNTLLIQNWQDYSIIVNSDGEISYDCPNEYFQITSHHIGVQAGNAWPGYVNVKIQSPWILDSSDDTRWIFSQAVWNQKDPDEFLAIPGVIDFKYQHHLSANLLLKLPKNGSKEYFIPAGTPLTTLTPLTEEKVNFNIKYASVEKINRIINRWDFSFNETYFRRKSFYRK